MTNRTALWPILLTVLIVVGMAVPVVALSPSASEATTSETTETTAAASPQSPQNNSSVNVTVGPQLSTVISVSSEDVQTGFGNTAFETSFENASEERRAEVLAERAEELRNYAESIREDYEEATEAFEDGELTKSEYAQRLATLNARATNLLDSYEQFTKRAATVSTDELDAADVDQPALNRSVENLSRVTGPGTSALLKQFTGEAEGEIELETENGLSIEVESEDGERSREFERPRDDDDSISVSETNALETARAALSTTDGGDWVLTESETDRDEGSYEFAFSLRNAANVTGEAEVSVDGSSGRIFLLEEEIEVDDDETDRDLTIVVADGTPGPNEQVTLQVLANGNPVANSTVYLNDQQVGTTDANGTVEVTLPLSEEVELRAQSDDSEAELDIEFDEEISEKLTVDAILEDETVTVAVTYDGDSVKNASVTANERAVGATNSDGTVAFTIDTNETEELELEIAKEGFETERTYIVQDGDLTQEDNDEDES
ncbi:DUF7096 domain-containing protein [Halorientalis salina]|uniref:DUF7096 domain-containing protein n=1 Tax=Halorientalis salina TaxID=2932266 RepID=UPI0010AB53D0|nr:DUF4198 domain-containing protein [Halorientalis salina]